MRNIKDTSHRSARENDGQQDLEPGRSKIIGWVLLGGLIDIAASAISRGVNKPESRAGAHTYFIDSTKRMFDIVNSTTGLIIVSAVFLIVAVLRVRKRGAWVYAFLAGAGIGGILWRLI